MNLLLLLSLFCFVISSHFIAQILPIEMPRHIFDCIPENVTDIPGNESLAWFTDSICAQYLP